MPSDQNLADVTFVAPTPVRERRVHASTYRLQLNPAFTFADAEAIVPYLSSLGVTACYISPPFTARPGSTHGYDVCRHNELNPELGGEAAFRSLAATVRAAQMGLIVDFVPNHMGVDPATNDWWWDVLENGPSSPFASYFDIDWEPLKPELQDRLLLPILGEQYGEALESGHLQLQFASGALVLTYNGLQLPINPRRAPIVFESALDQLTTAIGADDPHLREFLSILTALRNLPAYTERDEPRVVERHREKEVARERIVRLVESSEPIRRYIHETVANFNGTVGDLSSFSRLHALLELQAYRLASWRTASDEINYRRFFDINDLAGLRVEAPEVFDAIHRLVLQLVAEGTITGLRIDHIDGLLDPAAYLHRLQDAARAACGGAADPTPLYVVVEKVLTGPETLPDEWATAGTTGYNFLNDVNGLFVNARNARSVSRAYVRLTGRAESIADVMYHSKRVIIGTAMTSEFQVLASAANRLSESDWRSRDFTFGSIRRALREILACFPVYRTYVSETGIRPDDRVVVDAAIRAAQARNPATEPSIFEFLRTVLLPERETGGGRTDPNEARWEEWLKVAARFQQYTAPVQAKGVEDTAAYRYVALLSLNEVGGDLQQFGRSVAAFHRANIRRLERWPLEMTTTSTHDTKRGEDARARISVLSDIPGDWRNAAATWMRLNKPHHTLVNDEPAPDRNDEYHFYQALLAVWPPETADAPVPAGAPGVLVERVHAYMIKAIREAKVHTSWVNPNAPYETAVGRFVERTLRGTGAARFLPAFVPFARRVARLGAINALAQLVLKVASPGIPDLYQGTELWDLTLVDPDNRQPVDYAARTSALDELEPWLARAGTSASGPDDELARAAGALVDAWPDGRVKLFLTALGLRLRRMKPELFLHGTYAPLDVEGWRADHVVAFAREQASELLVAVVPRLGGALGGDFSKWPTESATWGDTRLRLRQGWNGHVFRHLITGELVTPVRTTTDDWIAAAQIFDRFPVALLWTERTGAS